MKWLHSRTAVVAAVAVLTIALGTWQGWLVQASPGTIYVNDNLLPDVEGCNAPDANTIADGITAADTGDTVVLCEGTYPGNVTVGKSVTIEGRAEADRANVIVQGGTGVDGFTVTVDDVNISHMKFDGVDVSGTGIHVTGDGATIEDVEAVDWVNGVYVDGSEGTVVDDCDMDDNNIGIYLGGGKNNEVRRNVTGDGNTTAGVVITDEDLALVADNDLSGSAQALVLAPGAGNVINVQVVRNTIHAGAGSDGIVIDVIDSAESLIIIGGRAEDANSFAGTPDGTTDYFVGME